MPQTEEGKYFPFNSVLAACFSSSPNHDLASSLLDYMTDGRLNEFGKRLAIAECKIDLFDQFPAIRAIHDAGMALQLTALQRAYEFFYVKKLDPAKYRIVPLAVSSEDTKLFGCPYCGADEQKNFMILWGGNCDSWLCNNCHRIYIRLYPGVNKSPLKIYDYAPSLSLHPRRAIAHDPMEHLDMRIVGRITT